MLIWYILKLNILHKTFCCDLLRNSQAVKIKCEAGLIYMYLVDGFVISTSKIIKSTGNCLLNSLFSL